MERRIVTDNVQLAGVDIKVINGGERAHLNDAINFAERHCEIKKPNPAELQSRKHKNLSGGKVSGLSPMNSAKDSCGHAR